MVEKATGGQPDSTNALNYGTKPGLGEDPSKGPMMIGGTHHVSTKINPETALKGGYTPINGDTMPAGAPTDTAPGESPYFPKN